MKYVGYYNGEIGPLEEMKIPMLDRAVYFGDGCYDATTFANNNIFAAAASCWKSRLKCRTKNWVPSCRNASMPMRLTTVCCTGSVPAELPIVDISFHLLP